MALIVNRAHSERGRLSVRFSQRRFRTRLDRAGCFHERLQPGLHQTSNRGRPSASRQKTADRSPRPRKASVPLAGQSKRRAHPGRSVPVRFELGGRAADSETINASAFLSTVNDQRLHTPSNRHRAAVQSKRRGPELWRTEAWRALVSQRWWSQPPGRARPCPHAPPRGRA